MRGGAAAHGRGMTATFLLIRHASTADLDVRMSGRRPGVPLSRKGREQTAALAEHLAGTRIDALIASPLDRTRETAGAVARVAHLPVVFDDLLIEIDMGEWTGVAFDVLHADPRWATWNAERDTARCPGGESMGEAQARIRGLMAREAARRPDQVIALVTHSDLIRAAVCDVLGLGLAAVHRFSIDPASITRMVVGNWGGRLLSMNEGAC